MNNKAGARRNLWLTRLVMTGNRRDEGLMGVFLAFRLAEPQRSGLLFIFEC